MTEDILELSALAPEHPQARLRTEADPEGTLYELAVMEDFGAVGLRRIGLLVAEMDMLWERDKLSVAQERRLEKLLNDLAGILIRNVPAESVAALPAITKRTLALRFFVFAQDGVRTSLGLTSESSSPGSNGSTEATPAAGLT